MSKLIDWPCYICDQHVVSMIIYGVGELQDSHVPKQYLVVCHSSCKLARCIDICKMLHLGMLNSINHTFAHFVKVFRSSCNNS